MRYIVQYTELVPWEGASSDEYYCYTREEAIAFIQRITKSKKIIDLTLITYEKLIWG